MFKVQKLMKELNRLIAEGKFVEAIAVNLELGKVLETFREAC